MKSLFYCTLFLIALVCSCKKDASFHPTSGTIQVQVTGLSATTDLNLSLACKCGRSILNINKQYGNKTYETLAVTTGDEIIIKVSSSVESDVAGNGEGNLKFIYNGEVIYVLDGNLMGTTGKSAVVKIP